MRRPCNQSLSGTKLIIITAEIKVVKKNALPIFPIPEFSWERELGWLVGWLVGVSLSNMQMT